MTKTASYVEKYLKLIMLGLKEAAGNIVADYANLKITHIQEKHLNEEKN